MHPTRPLREQDRPGARWTASRRAVIQSAGAGLATALIHGRGVSAQSTPAPDAGPTLTIPLYPYGRQIDLDPHRATNWGPHWVLLPNVWAGLLGFDENGAVIPTLAASVEPEEDGLVWVAEIRSEATFASGNPVTADAMIAGWKRALSPVRLAPMATYMRRVQGYEAFVAGESEEIGFEARDERIVAIHLEEPYSLFPEHLATFVWAAVDVAALDGVPESQSPYAGASAGAWMFSETGDPERIRMIQNDRASDLPTSFSTVDWTLLEGPQAAQAALDAFSTGTLPIADVPDPLRGSLKDNAAVQAALHTIEPSGTTMLVGMDYRQAPFDNPDVRRAVALSIDRERWATEIMGGTFVPATGVTPPVLEQTANYMSPDPIGPDPDTARQLLTDAGITEDTMPPVTYYQRADASQEEIDEAAALLAMIQENSGLVIDHDTTLSAEQIEARRSDNGGLQFDLRWWWPLTNSPSGLADLGMPTSPEMKGWFNWSTDAENSDTAAAAEEFATAITDALATLDETTRTQLFAKAEDILIQRAVYVPLGHWVQAFVQSAELTGTRQGAFTGYMPVAFDDAVEYTPSTATPSA